MRLGIQGTVDRVTSDLVFAVPKLTKASTVTALNKTNSKIGTGFRRKLASETGVSQKHFKKKIRNYRATYRRMSAKQFMGLRSSVPLARLVKGSRKGGLQKYEKLISESLNGRSAADAFLAKMPTGYEGIFVRSSRSDNKAGRDKNGRLKRGRLSIVEVRVRFDKVAPGVLERVGNQIGPAEFERQFIYDLRRRLANSANSSRRSRRR